MRDLDSEIDADRTPYRWTGRTILFTLFGFFGLVFAANGILVHEALSTMSGLDTESAYQAGQQFEHEVALAKAQDERHWHVDAKVTPARDGARLDIVARDAAGQPLERSRCVGRIGAADRSPSRSGGRLGGGLRRPLPRQCAGRCGPMGSRH